MRGVAWLTAMLALLLLLLPATAGAHAELTGTEPANEATITERPGEVSITFSESIKVAFGGVKAYGPDGERVDDGRASASGDTVTLPITADAAGTYAVSWRVISADGHPVRGAFVFHLDEASTDTISRDQALDASEGSRALDIAFGVARGVMLVAVLVTVGSMAFALLIAPGWQPRRIRTWLLVALLAMAATFVLDAAIAAGLSVLDTLDGAVIEEQATTVYGRASLIRMAVALLCLAAAWRFLRGELPRGRAGRILLLVPFLVLAACLSLSGHAVGQDMPFLRLPFDMLHSIAAALWIGGLVQLLRYARWDGLDPAAVRRYSWTALGSVIALVVTGLYAAWVEIGISLDGVLDTTYGRLVLVKAALLVATMPLANANRVRNVPRIGDPESGAADRMRRFVRGEIVLLVAVLAATAWLIQSVPAKVALRPGFIEQVADRTSGGTVQLILDPAEVGSNEWHVYAFTETRQPDDGVTEVTIEATNEERGIGPLQFELESVGPGHYTIPSATMPFAGEWDISALVRAGEFQEDIVDFSLRIAPASNDD